MKIARMSAGTHWNPKRNLQRKGDQPSRLSGPPFIKAKPKEIQ